MRRGNVSCQQTVTSVPRHDQSSFNSHPAWCNETPKKNKGSCRITFSPLTVIRHQTLYFHFILRLGGRAFCMNATRRMHTNDRIPLSECRAVDGSPQSGVKCMKETRAGLYPARHLNKEKKKIKNHEGNLFRTAVTFWAIGNTHLSPTKNIISPRRALLFHNHFAWVQPWLWPAPSEKEHNPYINPYAPVSASSSCSWGQQDNSD